MREAVIVASSRTPLAKSHRGSFNMTRPDDLAAHAIKDVLGKVPRLDPKEVEEVILGCGQPHGAQGHNIARIAALRGGLSVYTANSAAPQRIVRQNTVGPDSGRDSLAPQGGSYSTT